MSERLARLDPAFLWSVLQDPTAHPREAVLVIGVGVVLLIAVLLLIGIAFVSGEAARAGAVTETRRRRVRREAWVVAAAWMIASSALVFSGNLALTDRLTCLRCHVDRLEAAIEHSTPHTEVGCADCHAAPGVAGRLALGIQTASDLLLASTGTGMGIAGRLPSSEACLRCHSGVTEGTVSKIVRVSHAQFTRDATFRCLDCHGSVGHGPRGEPDDRPRMTLCLRCHDGETASAHCALCHPGGITDVRGVSKYDYPQVKLPPVTTCEGCHSMERCDACHGLRLPHPPGWATGPKHGRAAAFERRALCRKCHERNDCATDCHPHGAAPGDSHPADWRTQHGVSDSPEAQQACRACHFPGFGCRMCHD